MKVSFITGNLSRKGAGLTNACQNYTRHLLHEGVDVDIYGEWDPLFDVDRNFWPAVPLHAYKPSLHPSLHYLRQLPEDLLKNPAHLLHLHGLWTHWSIDGYRWKQKTGRPYIISAHGMLERWALAKSGWKKKLALAIYERRHLANANALHAVGKQEVEDYRRLGLHAPIHYIPNGVDIPTEPAPGNREKSILFMGRIQEKKGIFPLLEGWAQSTAHKQGWRLQIAGWDEGGCEARAKELATQLGIADQVDWLGPLLGQAKWDKLRQAGAFILPSFSEGVPMAILEAWAYSLPTLISDACNLPEAFELNASLKANPESDSIREILNQFCALPLETRLNFGKNGYELACSRYNASDTARKLKELYQSCNRNS